MSHHANTDASDREEQPTERRVEPSEGTENDSLENENKSQRSVEESDAGPQETVSWDEAASGFQRQLEQRRTVGVEIPDVGVAEFTLRGLSREERDEVERKAANVSRKGRRDAEVEVDTGAIRRTMLKYGIVSGPEGFKPRREDHLDRLPPGVQDELVDIVEDMSTLSVEERDGFQKVG